jgi:uncharacterized protein YbjQ (UPF0145 family)
MGPESSDPTSMNTSFEFVPLPADSPFLSDHGLGAPEPPPVRATPGLERDLSQFPPSSRSPSTLAPGSSLPERPRVPANPPPSPTGGFAVIQESISSFPLYMGNDDPYAGRRAGASSAAIPIGNPVGAGGRSPEQDLMARIKGVLITTTDSVQGRLVEDYLGPVDAEVVVPANQLLEGSEPAGKLFRHKIAQHRLRQYHQLVLAELRLEADKLGGTAVLGAAVRMQEVQGVLVFSAFGTAVRLS